MGRNGMGEVVLGLDFDHLHHPRRRHPERSRFSGGARDLLTNERFAGDPSARSLREPPAQAGGLPKKSAGLRDDTVAEAKMVKTQAEPLPAKAERPGFDVAT